MLYIVHRRRKQGNPCFRLISKAMSKSNTTRRQGGSPLWVVSCVQAAHSSRFVTNIKIYWQIPSRASASTSAVQKPGCLNRLFKGPKRTLHSSLSNEPPVSILSLCCAFCCVTWEECFLLAHWWPQSFADYSLLCQLDFSNEICVGRQPLALR